MPYQTEQERFWAGSFGDDYISRNYNEAILATKTANFAKMLSRFSGFTQEGGIRTRC